MRTWQNEEVFTLIKEYKARRYLWDKKHSLYKDHNKRDLEYQEIAEKFENCSVKDITDKVRNLRIVYMECMRKLKRKKLWGKEIPKWRFFSALGFLSSTIGDCGTPYAEMDEKKFKDDVEMLPSLEQSLNTVLNEEEESMPSEENPLSSVLKRKRKVNDGKCKKVKVDKREIEVEDNAENSNTMNDHNYAKFGAFVASAMESMKDSELEKLCEVKIRMILAEMCQEAAQRQLIALERPPICFIELE